MNIEKSNLQPNYFTLYKLSLTTATKIWLNLQANRDWGECNSSVETGDSEECSSGSGSSEAPLYTASKVILLQHLARVAASLPRPHHTFTPGGLLEEPVLHTIIVMCMDGGKSVLT